MHGPCTMVHYRDEESLAQKVQNVMEATQSSTQSKSVLGEVGNGGKGNGLGGGGGGARGIDAALEIGQRTETALWGSP